MTDQQKRRYKVAGQRVAIGSVAVAGLERLRHIPVQYALTFGGKQGRATIPMKRIETWQHRVLYPRLPGYTLQTGLGRYTNELGEAITEPSRRVLYAGKLQDYPKMRRLARSYAKVFGQDSAMMGTSPSFTRFVGSKAGRIGQTLARLARLKRIVPLG